MPVAIGIYADNNFMSYNSGIIDTILKERGINHAVVVVGYGYDPLL
jgi:hypothetical protein